LEDRLELSLGLATDVSGNVALAASLHTGAGFRASTRVAYSRGGSMSASRQPTIFGTSGAAQPYFAASGGIGGVGGSISANPINGTFLGVASTAIVGPHFFETSGKVGDFPSAAKQTDPPPHQ